jgi:hypothetical protein
VWKLVVLLCIAASLLTLVWYVASVYCSMWIGCGDAVSVYAGYGCVRLEVVVRNSLGWTRLLPLEAGFEVSPAGADWGWWWWDFGIGGGAIVLEGPIWGLSASSATLGALLWLWRVRGRPRLDGSCSRCGYDLTGLTEPRCPECGEAFDGPMARAASGNSQRTKGMEGPMS